MARPTVVPKLFASLRPQTYDQDLAKREKQFPQWRDNAEADAELADDAAAAEPTPEGSRDVQIGEGRGRARQFRRRQSAADRPFNLQQGGQSMAEAAKVGELFRYEHRHARHARPPPVGHAADRQ